MPHLARADSSGNGTTSRYSFAWKFCPSRWPLNVGRISTSSLVSIVGLSFPGNYTKVKYWIVSTKTHIGCNYPTYPFRHHSRQIWLFEAVHTCCHQNSLPSLFLQWLHGRWEDRWLLATSDHQVLHGVLSKWRGLLLHLWCHIHRIWSVLGDKQFRITVTCCVYRNEWVMVCTPVFTAPQLKPSSGWGGGGTQVKPGWTELVPGWVTYSRFFFCLSFFILDIF